PVTRGVIGTTMPAIVVSPGRVWSEPADGGMSRASLPFIVTNPLYNEMYNGVATFLFDDTRVSGFHAQIVQETAPFDDRSDVWTTSPMPYSPGAIAGEGAL